MAAGTKTSTSKIALLLVFIPLVWLAWWASDLFLPKWRWLNLDFPKLAIQTGMPEAELKREYKMTVRFNPRGDGDPVPWQVITMDPAWADVNEKNADETNVLVRCVFISDFTGNPPSSLQLGSGGQAGWQDRYFTCTARRFPSGLFGKGYSKRPIVVFKGLSLDKMDKGAAMHANGDIVENPRKWQDDDNWDDREDGWRPAETTSP